MLRANSGYVIVEPLVNSAVRESGIVVPESSVEPTCKGRVVDIPTYELIDDEQEQAIVEGTIVYFIPYSGHEVEYEGSKLLVLKDEEILAFESEQ